MPPKFSIKYCIPFFTTSIPFQPHWINHLPKENTQGISSHSYCNFLSIWCNACSYSAMLIESQKKFLFVIYLIFNWKHLWFVHVTSFSLPNLRKKTQYDEFDSWSHMCIPTTVVGNILIARWQSCAQIPGRQLLWTQCEMSLNKHVGSWTVNTWLTSIICRSSWHFPPI